MSMPDPENHVETTIGTSFPSIALRPPDPRNKLRPVGMTAESPGDLSGRLRISGVNRRSGQLAVESGQEDQATLTHPCIRPRHLDISPSGQTRSVAKLRLRPTIETACLQTLPPAGRQPAAFPRPPQDMGVTTAPVLQDHPMRRRNGAAGTRRAILSLIDIAHRLCQSLSLPSPRSSCRSAAPSAASASERRCACARQSRLGRYHPIPGRIVRSSRIQTRRMPARKASCPAL